MTKNGSWVARRLGDLSKLVRASEAAQVGLFRGGWRFLDLALRYKFSPQEIFVLGLLDGRLASEPDAATSNERLLEIQSRLNPLACTFMTEDKLAFHQRCVELSLPVPDLLAVVGGQSTLTADRVRLPDITRLAQALCSGRWGGVVLKPTYGVHGQGVLALDCAPRRVTAPGGVVYDCSGLVQHMRSSGFDAWIVQRRLRPHPDVVTVTQSEALCTCRITTLADSSGDVRVLAARLRLAGPGTSVDNISHGSTGNIVANISLAKCSIASVIQPRSEGVGYGHIDRHPATGAQLVGWQVPLFRQAYELAISAGSGFAALRTVGWDIGISTEGVVLIEGNAFWDAGIGVDSWPEVVRTLRAAAFANEHR
jgi:hypothetical protein